MRIDIISVFPHYFDNLNESLLGKAQQDGLVNVYTHDLRDWTHDVHRSVDDTPTGGGAGMVMKPSVWAECLDDLLQMTPDDSHAISGAEMQQLPLSDIPNSESATPSQASKSSGTSGVSLDSLGDSSADTPVLIFPEPSAPQFTQKAATQLSRRKHILFGCGRYEGIDARVSQYYADHGVDVREYSIGDYVLNGGEVAVSVMIEAITRLLPGFMGNPESIVDESYTGDPLLEYRQFTHPSTWRGISVPDVLLSGDHGKVDRFHRDESLARTTALRPDLVEQLDCHAISKQDRKTLIALGWDVSGAHPRRLQ